MLIDLERLKEERDLCHYAMRMFKWLFDIAPNEQARDYWFAWNCEAFAACFERGEAIIAHYKHQRAQETFNPDHRFVDR